MRIETRGSAGQIIAMPATLPPLDVLFEDNHVLAVNKPPRLLTAGDRTGDVSLLDLAREYIRTKYPENK